jgi:hypothetical protein
LASATVLILYARAARVHNSDGQLAFVPLNLRYLCAASGVCQFNTPASGELPGDASDIIRNFSPSAAVADR